jgi:RNA-binding protein Musashi
LTIFANFKKIDPKRAIPREEQERTAKIFVGGVSPEATEEIFRDFFSKFGRVIDATLMMDKDTMRPRGFGFVTFDGDAAVERTLANQPLIILGKQVEVKRAEPRGNMHEESGGRGGKFGRRGKFGQQDGNQAESSGPQNQQMGSQQGAQDFSPSQMAKYWYMMQQYFQNMQQMMAMKMQGGMPPQGMPPMMGDPNMNPAMMQQMQQMMQQQRMQGNQSPTMPGMPGGPPMDPAMMQQMMQQGGFGPGSPQSMSGMMSPNKPGFTAIEQNAFEQAKYERQQVQRMQQQQFAATHSSFGQGGPTSWEGMYDDVPQPNPPPSGPRNANNGGGGGRGGPGPQRGNQHRGGGHHNKHQQNTPPVQPNNAPANAPTGPKNAGKPGANYRGGAPRGGHRYHPYGRN